MAEFNPDAYLAKPFDPDRYLTGAKDVPASSEPMAPINGMPTFSNPAAQYDEGKSQRGILKRMNEGAAAPIQDLGISEENRKKYPWLNYLQPQMRTLDMIAKTPASAWGAISGLAGGLVEKVQGSAQGDRMQRDMGVLPAAIAPEVPMAAPEAAAMRRAARVPEAPPAARAPPLPIEPPPLPPEVSAIPRQVERPNVGVGLLNTDVEHALPAAQSRALSAAGNGGPLEGMSPDTIAFLRQKMEQQGFTKHTIDQRLEEMSAHHFFGEITPSLELDMSGIAGHAGPGRLEVMGSQRQRAIEGPERAGHSLTRAFGESENIPQMQRVMDIEKKREADPLYARFRSTEITPTPEIDALLPRLQAAGVLQSANRALEIEGLPSAQGFRINGEPPTTATGPTAGAFQLALEQISDRVGTAMREGNRNEARRYTNLRNSLIDALDNHPNVGDTWKQARTAHARPQGIKDAIELGRGALSNKVSAEELPFLTSHYSEPEMRGLRVGIHDSLRRMLGKRDTLTAELHNTVLAPNNEAKLRWAIGDQATDKLLNEFGHERHIHGSPTRATGNSPTASRTQAMNEWNGATAAEGLTLEDAADFAKKPVRASVAAALKFRSAQKKAANEAKWARIREEAARVMTLQGPERDAVARYLVEGPPEQRGFARGGKIKAHRVKQNGFVYHLQPDGSYK